MKRLSALDWAAFVLVIIGGIAWGLLGFINFDLVATIFGKMGFITRIIYILVGLSAIYIIINMGSYGRK